MRRGGLTLWAGLELSHTVDGGHLARLYNVELLQPRTLFFNIGIERRQKEVCSEHGNLAPPQTDQLSMLKRGCGDASSRHGKCVLRGWCKISSIHCMFRI